jgi:heme a synthase
MGDVAVTQLEADQTATASTAAPTWLRRIYLINLIAQIGIVVTGGLVRLTGSGLGCPTWPECVDGSLVPTEHQAETWHKYIEFGNRMLTTVLIVVAIAAVVATLVWSRQRRALGMAPRRPIVRLAVVPLIGTVAQALLGGMTVLTGLNPATVSAHFLLSIAIISATTVLVTRAGEDGDEPIRLTVRPQLRIMAWALVVLAGAIVTLGTIVTGSGPHAGDADAPRFGLDQRVFAWMHADAVVLFIGLQIGMLVAISLTSPPRAVRGRAIHLLAITGFNGLVGYSQLATGLPWLLVAVHMLLACLVWVAALRLLLSTRDRTAPAPRDHLVATDRSVG